jgi:TonB-linked SusC/RagA family outer membrane protein
MLKVVLTLKKPALMFVAMLLCMNAWGQEVSISGKVISEDDKQGLPGVSILVKGTLTGTVTDRDGNYKINVPKGQTLVYSFLGMETKEIVVGDQTTIDIALSTSIISLGEVVVTALGIKREKKEIGYSVSELSGSQLSTALEVNPLNALSGKVAGVDISTTAAGPSGSSRVVIRGNSKLDTENQPLYVVDGVPMDNTQLGSAGMWGGYDLGGGISSLNANDIESVTVLKGASASALYGSRASNGVILITTKSGKSRKGVGIDFTSNYTTEKVLSRFDDYQTVYGMGRDGEIPTEGNALTTQVAWGAKLDPNLMVPIYNGDLKPYGVVENNILSFFRTGSTATNTLSLSGGSDKANVRISLSDMRNQDIVPGSGLRRNTFLINSSVLLADRLTVTGKVNYINEKVDNRPALSDNPNNIGLAVIGIAPNFDQRWLSENYKDENGNYADWNGNNIYRINPYWSINEIQNNSSRNRIMGFLQTNYKINDWLDFQVRGGTDFYTFRYTNLFPKGTPVWEIGMLEETTSNIAENNYEALLKFNKTINEDLSISAFAGGNIMHFKREEFNAIGRDMVLNGVNAITNFKNQSNGYIFAEKQINSLYGSAQVGYQDTYFLDATFRNDWSSTLRKGNNSYFYPSVSGSFIFTNLLQNVNPLSFGKLRASWAEVGGDANPFELNLTYGLKNFSLLGKPLGEISNTSIPNLDLKPTRTFSYEFGTELKFFKNRISLDVAYYKTSTKDQILRLGIPPTAGYNTAVINAGEITNTGIEIALSGTAVSISDFNWDVSINYSKNVNRVVSLHELVKDYPLASARWAGASVMATEGQPFGVIVGKKLARDPNGNVIHNAAGLPTFGDKQEVLGNGVYKWISGINNTFTYKNFRLSALIDMKFGADMYSMGNAIAHANGTSENTLEGRDGWYESEEARLAAGISPLAWDPTGGYVGKGVVNTGTSDAPVFVENTIFVNPQDYWGTFLANSPEPFIYDATYAKLREVIFGYTLPSSLTAKTPLESVSVSFVARNLFILYSNIPNVDPESNYNNGNGQGFEYGSIPSRRSFGVSLNARF